MNLAIGILIGGKSRRMGTPKALIPIGGETLLERTVQTARIVTDELLLLGQPFFDLPTSLKSLPIAPDHHPRVGPLAGLEALLRARPLDQGLLLACDMPNLCAELLNRLTEPADDSDAAVCSTATDPQWHPCCAVYKSTCLPAVQLAIEEKRYGMMDLLARLRVRRVELTGDEARWVENWNEPQDLPAESRQQRRPC